MAQTIKLKRSATSGATPTTSQLELGEVAINTYDGKMYIKKNVGGTESIVEIGGGTGGSSTLSGLSDVTISSAAADQLLQYNGSEWVNVSIAEASAIMKEYQFTATAGQSTFSGSDDNSETLSYTAGAIQVFLNGIFLDSAVDYTATNGTSIVLSETVDANDYLQVVAFKKKIGDGNVSVDTFTGDDSTTAFTLSVDPGDENNTRVFIDGVYQSKDNYSVSGTTLTFSTAPPTSTAIEVEIGNRVVTLDTLSDLDLPDNVKLRLGTDQDLQIYHDGSNGFIKNTTGDLYIEDSNGSIRIRPKTGESGINVLADSSVELYYDNSKKLETSNDGVTVTGDVEADEFIGDVRGAVLFKAQAGEALAKGEVVYISGISGNTTVVSKADADDASKMPAFGLVAAAASSGNPVDIYTNGILSDIDTSAYSEGDELFVSTTAGALTATAPTGESSALQKIGKVTRSNATSGSIFIVGAGRSNAVPNLNDGDIFIGNASNQAVSASLNTKIESYLDGGTSTPTFAGLTTTADMTFGDNDKAIFGAGSDLQIFHDGSNSYISDQGAGQLRILASQFQVMNPAGTESMVFGAQNNTATLYYDNAAKLATTSTGIDVTGTVLSDGLRFGTTTDHTIKWGSGAEILGIGSADQSVHIRLDPSDASNFGNFKVTDGASNKNLLLVDDSGDISFYEDTGTSAKFFWDASAESLGIGTTSPSFTSGGGLQVYNAGQANVRISSTVYHTDFAQSGADTYLINRTTSGDIKFRVNSSTELLTLDGGTGSVGIAQTSPSSTYKLDVGGSVRSATAAPSFALQETDASNQTWLLGSYGGTFAIRDVTGGTYPVYVEQATPSSTLYLDSTGNVGIGTASPLGKLHVNSGNQALGFDSGLWVSANPSDYTVGRGTGITMQNADVYTGGIYGIRELNSWQGALAFYTHTSSSGNTFGTTFTEKMRISSDGNVGIGTTAPGTVHSTSYGTTKLHIDGGTDRGQIVVEGDNTAILVMSDNGATANSRVFITQVTDGVMKFKSSNDNGTSKAELIAMTSAGNVGIGTDSPTQKLEVTGTALVENAKLKAIAESNTDTAVDVFVYDTRKDSDGGAWRKRTQNTSWYNETLNTSTRGSRREFPCVAVIVADNDLTDPRVTIYDGDDPNMPLWMEFFGNQTADLISGGAGVIGPVTALNGIVCVGATTQSSSGAGGIKIIDFISDRASQRTNKATGSQIGYYKGNLEQRNDALSYGEEFGTAGRIAGIIVNDVAMTVLPNAPIDADTGLPVPTIAVATPGGVSVIKDDGTVYDSSDGSVYGSIEFIDERIISDRQTSDTRYFISQKVSSIVNDGWSTYEYYTGDFSTGYPRLLSDSGSSIIKKAKDHSVRGADKGLSFWDWKESDNDSSQGAYFNKSLMAFVASNYNTGWMHGDIKLAALSDTSTTNLVSTDLLGGIGNFTDANAWNVSSGWSLSSNVATGSAVTAYLTPVSNGILTAGRRYAVTVTQSSYTSGTLYLYMGTGAPGVGNHYINLPSATGTYTYILNAYNSNFGIYGAGYTGVIDNVTVSLADSDRSVNSKGLQVFGTVTKSAVATGAELVGYSGFSSSNYLEQPYNSDLDFGTGDFSIIGWYTGSADGRVLLERLGADQDGTTSGATDETDRLYIYTAVGKIYLQVGTDNFATPVPSNGTYWRQLAVVRRSGTIYVYQNGTQYLSRANTQNVGDTDHILRIGTGIPYRVSPATGNMALWRISATAPSEDQIKKIYNDEKHLFQENAGATLAGTSDAVTALAYDDDTELLHVGSSWGRSVFQGLRRVDNTTDAVGSAISASNGFIVED